MHTKSKLLLVINLFIILNINSFSQEVKNSDYIIFTIKEKNLNNKQERIFFWITPIDSLTNNTFPIYPLFLSWYSKNNFEKCCNGFNVDIFTSTTASTYNFTENYLNDVELLKQIIAQKGEIIQVITKRWSKKVKIELKISATPITGKFCSCRQILDQNIKLDYNGIIFLPLSDFCFNDCFWNNEKSWIIKWHDFSTLKYVNTL